MLSPRGDQPHDAPSPPDMGAGGVYEWEAGLPTAAELTPVSHQLIPRALAAAFRIHVAGDSASSDSPTSHLSFRGAENDYYYEEEEDEEEEEEEETEVAGAPEDGAGRARAVQVGKKQRMVWTAELHRRFIEAVAQLGDKAAVPKAIVRVMNVEGMTREHVASHLQKYRVYLKNTRDTNAAPPGHPTHGFPFGAQPSSDTSNSRGCSSSLSREGGKVFD